MSDTKLRRGGRIGPVALAALVVTVLLGTSGGAVAGALITGKQIKDGTVTGADIRNGSLAGADIRNGSITGTDIKDEARIFGAYAGGSSDEELDNFVSDTYVPIVSKSLTVRRGYLHITASVYAQSDTSLGNQGSLALAVRVDGKTVQSDARLDTTTGADFGETGTLTVVVPVSSGKHTVSLIARDDALGSYIFERSVSVVWTAGGSVSGDLFTPRVVTPRSSNR
ncbi:hypothetical protein [Nocardioides sp. SYSU DS0651]|uniref:hypothetical protein n=1 Tax=Nocardioides sp. SYSU DS0651 TaxID=3415955 RepID=UPI003F4C44CA